MTNLSKRFLRGRLMEIQTSASLSAIRAVMMSTRPDLASKKAGWGSIDEDPDLFGPVATQPPASNPQILPAIAGRRPDVLAARLYWFYELTRRRFGVTAVTGPQWGLGGTDVLISADGPGKLLLFVASHNDDDIDNHVLTELQNAIYGLDSSVTISSVKSSRHFGNADFFLWMTRQHFVPAPVGAAIDVDQIDFISVRDALDQQTHVARGVHLGRVEFVTLLASPTKSFGPATVSVTVTPYAMSMEFQLALSGAFEIAVKSIKYKGVTFTSVAEMRLQAVTDLIYVLLPEMKAAYEQDTSWTSGPDRDAFRANMKALAMSGVGNL